VSSATTKLLHATQKVINNKSKAKHLEHANSKRKITKVFVLIKQWIKKKQKKSLLMVDKMTGVIGIGVLIKL
jgi:hypothetical protein